MSRNTTRRTATTSTLTSKYMQLKKANVPSFVTAHEAYRMTDGRVGTKSDHNLRHGFGLMDLVKRSGGELHEWKIAQDMCDHEELLPIPGLPAIESCMDCGGSFAKAVSIPRTDPKTGAIVDLRTLPIRGAIVSYTASMKRSGETAQWRVRHADLDGTLTLDLIGHRKHNTARFGVDPAKVTVVQGAPELY